MRQVIALMLLAVASTNAQRYASTNAQTYVSDVWLYEVNNGEATIKGLTAMGLAVLTEYVEFPSEVNGIPVREIRGNSDQPSPVIYGMIKSVSIPSSVRLIGEWAFYGLPLTSITIPNSVTSIGASAFYCCTSLTSVTIPNSVTSIGNSAFNSCNSLINVAIPNSVTSIGDSAFSGCTSLTNVTVPNSVTFIGMNAFAYCSSLTSITMPDRFIAQVAQIGISGQVATDYLVSALANNDAFVTAVANKIKTTGGNFGIATQSGVSNIVTATTSNLATKAELTASLSQSRTDGINSVLSNPNLWTLYTTNQIKNMAIGDLVLSKQVNGQFVLNYDIEQSEDMQTWTPYLSYTLPMTNLPTDKAFVRIKAK